MADQERVALRRTVQPYIGVGVIFSCVTILVVYESLKSSDWQFALLFVCLVIPLFSFGYLNFGLKYRVLWDGAGVYMRASGGPERHIGFDEISSIRYKVSASQSRPFRRIEIHGAKRDAKAFVDVSLRHFRLDDIDTMMKEIRAHWPDLRVPTVSMNGRVEFVEPKGHAG